MISQIGLGEHHRLQSVPTPAERIRRPEPRPAVLLLL